MWAAKQASFFSGTERVTLLHSKIQRERQTERERERESEKGRGGVLKVEKDRDIHKHT